MNPMHNPTNSNGYLLLFRNTNWHLNLSPEEIQQTMGAWGEWFERLKSEGTLVSGSPLENEGRVISANSGKISDGPFTESKEAVGGFFHLNVATIDEAEAIGRECPALVHGIIVEVRPVAPACPAERMAAEVRAHINA